MTRPLKNKVDYVQHDVKKSRSLKIMINHFGDTGYRFWFELLSILGDTENHCYEVNDLIDLEYIAAEAGTTPDMAIKMIHKLGGLSCIDRVLLGENKIWCQNMVDRLEPLYKDFRKRPAPTKPPVTNKQADYLSFPSWLSLEEPDKPDGLSGKSEAVIVLPVVNPSSIVKDSIVKNLNTIVQDLQSKYEPVILSIYKSIMITINNFRPNHPLNISEKDIKQIQLMISKDKRLPADILTIIDWYKNHIGQEYIPEIFSIGSLREKYDKLVNAYHRKQSKPKSKHDENMDVAKKLLTEAEGSDNDGNQENSDKLLSDVSDNFPG